VAHQPFTVAVDFMVASMVPLAAGLQGADRTAEAASTVVVARTAVGMVVDAANPLRT
jgi:mannitol-specific phosphotransferase system IIBC component